MHETLARLFAALALFLLAIILWRGGVWSVLLAVSVAGFVIAEIGNDGLPM